MSRRITVCALLLALAAAVLVPAPSSAQVFPGSWGINAGASWFVALWDQFLDRLVPRSEAGIQIDGNGFASQITSQAGIQIDGNGGNGTNSEAGIQIDGNGRPVPTADF